jgi:hypothetical protein
MLSRTFANLILLPAGNDKEKLNNVGVIRSPTAILLHVQVQTFRTRGKWAHVNIYLYPSRITRRFRRQGWHKLSCFPKKCQVAGAVPIWVRILFFSHVNIEMRIICSHFGEKGKHVLRQNEWWRRISIHIRMPEPTSKLMEVDSSILGEYQSVSCRFTKMCFLFPMFSINLFEGRLSLEYIVAAL